MKTTMTLLLRIVGAVGVAIVFYAMLAGPALLLGDGSNTLMSSAHRVANR